MSDVKELHRQFREAQRRKRECRGQMIKIFPGDVERLKQRLLNNRVEVEGPLPTQCWQWTGATLQNGYGLIRHRGRQFKAHRLAYYLFVGDFPEEAYICHHCDNKGCVNPSHAYVGDAQTNSDDKWNVEILRFCVANRMELQSSVKPKSSKSES